MVLEREDLVEMEFLYQKNLKNKSTEEKEL
jgi:hypothetical protein